MGHPHETQFPREFGRSPGNGTTEMPLSADPLATEGEATPGPDDVNPYEEERTLRREPPTSAPARRDDGEEVGSSLGFDIDPTPTGGDDPFTFDDVDESVAGVELPSVDDGPDFSFGPDF